MLDGIEDAINACFHGGFHEATGGLSDGLQTFQNGFRILAHMDDQRLAAGQVFGLGQRAENSLQQGYIRAQAGTDLTKTVYLSGKMRGLARVEHRQAFPILRRLDGVAGIAARPFGGPSQASSAPQSCDGKRGSRSDFYQVEIVMMLEVQRGGCQ